MNEYKIIYDETMEWYKLGKCDHETKIITVNKRLLNYENIKRKVIQHELEHTKKKTRIGNWLLDQKQKIKNLFDVELYKYIKENQK